MSTLAAALLFPLVTAAAAVDTEAPTGPPIEDPSGAALRSFYEALEQTELGLDGAVTRVLHMGDSSMGLDGLAHPIRRRMQERFGDAGPGFLPTRGYTKNYQPKVAKLSGSSWSSCYIGKLCAEDGYYGLGGRTFSGRSGAWAKFTTTKAGSLGEAVSHYEIWYAVQPRGAALEFRVDGGDPESVDTSQIELADAVHWIDVDAGAHELEVRVRGSGQARVFGVVAENDGPGVVWDSVTMVGAFTRRLEAYDDTHIQTQVANRRPDLLVLNYGGNDLLRFVKGNASSARYLAELKSVVNKLRAGRPRMACLIAGIVDHGKSGGLVVDPKHVRRMIDTQRAAAAELGCGFYDTVAAMGGTGSMVRWSRRGLAEPDLVHLNRSGRRRVGRAMFEALMVGYADYTGAARGPGDNDD